MSIIRRSDHHHVAPLRATPHEETRGGFTFIELLIVFGTLATLTLAVCIAIETDRKASQEQRTLQHEVQLRAKQAPEAL